MQTSQQAIITYGWWGAQAGCQGDSEEGLTLVEWGIKQVFMEEVMLKLIAPEQLGGNIGKK